MSPLNALLAGSFPRGNDRGGWVPRGDYGGGAPRRLPCGCRAGKRCTQAQAMWLAMNAAARTATRTGRYNQYTYLRQEFIRHYTGQAVTPGAILATTWR
jgi:hypothetical protein